MAPPLPRKDSMDPSVPRISVESASDSSDQSRSTTSASYTNQHQSAGLALRADKSRSAASGSISIRLAIIYDGQEINNACMNISSSGGNYGLVCKRLEELQENFNVVGSACEAILSHDGGKSLPLPFNDESQANEALKKFKAGRYTEFVIQEIVDIVAENQLTRRGTLTRDMLRISLENQIESSKYKGKYIPRDQLEEWILIDQLKQCFKEDEEFCALKTERRDQLVKSIHERGQMFLATVILANIHPFGNFIDNFEKSKMLDSNMPFNPDHPPRCSKNLIKNNFVNFLTRQWDTTAVILKKYHTDDFGKTLIRDERVLPFTKMDVIHDGSGAFGDVYEVEIDPAHQEIVNYDYNPAFALKRLKKSADQTILAFEREINALLHISTEGNADLQLKSNPHLMELLTAFQHGEEFLLIFPLAKGSLKQRFDEEEQHVGDPEYFFWMLQQFCGLAEGLWRIHGDEVTNVNSGRETATKVKKAPEPFLTAEGRLPEPKMLGYHHDLKPANILIRTDSENQKTPFNELELKYGRLQIADFGLGRFREAATGSKSQIKGTTRYAAPETVTQKEQSRPYDIWSFGCMLIEVLTWLLYGKKSVVKFLADRLYREDQNIRDDGFWLMLAENPGRKEEPEIKGSVLDALKKIRQQKVLREFKNTTDGLEVIIQQCLHTNPIRRPVAKDLVRDLRKVATKTAKPVPSKKPKGLSQHFRFP